MQCVERFTSVSRSCCRLVAGDAQLMSELLQHLRRCNRTKPHESTLLALLGVLANLCRYPELLGAVFKTVDCVEVLSEKLQMFRDTEVRATGVGSGGSVAEGGESAFVVDCVEGAG